MPSQSSCEPLKRVATSPPRVPTMLAKTEAIYLDAASIIGGRDACGRALSPGRTLSRGDSQARGSRAISLLGDRRVLAGLPLSSVINNMPFR